MSVTIVLARDKSLSAKLLDDAAIAEAAAGLQAWVDHPHDGPAAAWSQGPYTVVSVPIGHAPPGDAHTWIATLAASTGVPSAAGYHDVANGAPYAVIGVADILSYNMEWTGVASHEIVEMLVDRWCTDLVQETLAGTAVACEKEACDPCETQGTTFAYGAGKSIYVTEFCLPAYFYPGTGTRYSSLGSCPAPLTPAPGGRQGMGMLGPLADFGASARQVDYPARSLRSISLLRNPGGRP